MIWSLVLWIQREKRHCATWAYSGSWLHSKKYHLLTFNTLLFRGLDFLRKTLNSVQMRHCWAYDIHILKKGNDSFLLTIWNEMNREKAYFKIANINWKPASMTWMCSTWKQEWKPENKTEINLSTWTGVLSKALTDANEKEYIFS